MSSQINNRKLLPHTTPEQIDVILKYLEDDNDSLCAFKNIKNSNNEIITKIVYSCFNAISL